MSHVQVIKDNYETLLRCVHIEEMTIASLRAEGAIDDRQKRRLLAEKSLYDRCVILFDWLQQNYESYEKFLNIMASNQQEHVTNLLTGKSDGPHVPLSNSKYARLIKITPYLLNVIHNSTALIDQLKGDRAISEPEYQELKLELTNIKKNSLLVDAILRRSNYSYECFEKVLRETRQAHVADLLKEGEVLELHVNTNHPELDQNLASEFNKVAIDELNKASQSSLLNAMNGVNLPVLAARPDQSILFFIYCKKANDMIKFTKLYDNGGLKRMMAAILKKLLNRIEPHSTIKLKVKNLRLDDENVLLIQRFTGIHTWKIDRFCIRESTPAARLNLSERDFSDDSSVRLKPRKPTLQRAKEISELKSRLQMTLDMTRSVEDSFLGARKKLTLPRGQKLSAEGNVGLIQDGREIKFDMTESDDDSGVRLNPAFGRGQDFPEILPRRKITLDTGLRVEDSIFEDILAGEPTNLTLPREQDLSAEGNVGLWKRFQDGREMEFDMTEGDDNDSGVSEVFSSTKNPTLPRGQNF